MISYKHAKITHNNHNYVCFENIESIVIRDLYDTERAILQTTPNPYTEEAAEGVRALVRYFVHMINT